MTDFFPPDSAIRRISMEPVLMLGAGRALLLQLAHPAVAHGVEDHSEFKKNPFTRLQGTLEATYSVVFGSEELALGIGRRLRWIHDFVVGPTYRANDPANLMWVHATLVDTTLDCYTAYVGTLTDDEMAAYYRDTVRVAEVFGVPRDAQPATIGEFREYVDATIAGLEVTDAGRDLAAFILRPRLPGRVDLPLAPMLALQRLLTVGTTPPRLREQFGLTWSADDERRFRLARGFVRAVTRNTPRAVRVAPSAASTRLMLRQAERHVSEWGARRAA